jgi:hypothetical protein
LLPRPPCIHAKQGFSLHFFNKINKQKNALSKKNLLRKTHAAPQSVPSTETFLYGLKKL